MKRLPYFLSAVVIAAASSAAFAQAPAAASETNADMARDAQVQGGKATKAERQAARKKRLSGSGSAAETNADIAQDAVVKSAVRLASATDKPLLFKRGFAFWGTQMTMQGARMK